MRRTAVEARWRIGAIVLCLCAVAAAQTPEESKASTTPGIVSIVIDDLGYNPRADRRALALPGPVAVAILPHTASASALADEARRRDKEVLLHLPMDPNGKRDGEGNAEAGPGRIELEMSRREIVSMFAYDLQTVPHAVGVNNHMGSQVTQSSEAMQALMSALRKHGNLFFLDSRTTPNSVAGRVAREFNVPALERDVFLDPERGDAAVRESLHRLERLIAKRGHAIAIGHPYPETLAALERWLPDASARGIRLVPLSTMLATQPMEPGDAERTAAPRPGL